MAASETPSATVQLGYKHNQLLTMHLLLIVVAYPKAGISDEHELPKIQLFLKRIGTTKNPTEHLAEASIGNCTRNSTAD